MKRLALSAALLLTLSACATTSDIEATRNQIDQVNRQASARLSEVESKLSNEKLLEMVNQVDSLKAEVAKLRGEVEVANYNLQTSPDYDKALNLLRARDFPKATAALSLYVQQNPNTPQAVDALYWLGVAHTAQRQYDAAIEIHRRFAEQFPDNPKAPDALRNVANCQRDLGQADSAKTTLKRLIKLYPASSAAQKAREQLTKM